VSLVYTTVTSNTILSSTSSLFTYLLSIAVLGESYTHGKLASIMACIAGGAPPLLLLHGASPGRCQCLQPPAAAKPPSCSARTTTTDAAHS
jgi:hypothetical protein